jgi:hypothetical protein
MVARMPNDTTTSWGQFNVANVWELQSKRRRKRAGHTQVIGDAVTSPRICGEARAASLRVDSLSEKYLVIVHQYVKTKVQRWINIDQFPVLEEHFKERRSSLGLTCENDSSHA